MLKGILNIHSCFSMYMLDILILAVFLFSTSSADVFVVTNDGPIRGTASSRDDVNAFLGIPFAEPPVGDMRFAKPVAKSPWTKTYDATKLPPPCAQFPIVLNFTIYFLPDYTNNSEDCLYLNIWAPKDPPTIHKRPVYIYIHHGSFFVGSGIQYDGSNLASQADMVVVSINYRLGSFGFFLAFIEEANGNMGMYDQLMAIQWIRNNVESFGGDPENIILSGASAGAISVGVHLVSPLTQKLFRKGHIQSGSTINPVYMDVNKKLFQNSERIASIAGCTNQSVTLKNNPRLVVECMKAKPKEAIIEADITLSKANPAVFFPRVGDEFLPKDTTLLYREGKFRKDAEVLYGTGSNEGGLLLVGALHSYVGFDGKIPMPSLTRRKAALLGKFASKLGGVKNPEEKINFYMDQVKNPSPAEYLIALSYATGDFAVSCGTVFLSDFLSLKGSRVYYYKFAFHAASTPLADWIEATHLDDVQYIFGNPYHEDFTAEEVQLSKRLIARISSFARTGNPTIPEEVPWMQYSYHEPYYLHIGQEEESIRIRPYNRCEIWRKEFECEIGSDVIQSLSELNEISSELNELSSNSSYSSMHRTSWTFLFACLCLSIMYGLSPFKQLL